MADAQAACFRSNPWLTVFLMSGKLTAATCILLAIAGAFVWWLAWSEVSVPRVQGASVAGRVALRGLDGVEMVPERVEVRVFARERIADALAAWLAGREAERVGAESALASARRRWEECNAARREAARIVQVAERSNAADLPLCRLRLRRAEEDAQHAYGQLEHFTEVHDTAADAATVLDVLPAPDLAAQADDSGCFSFELPPGGSHVLVLSAPGDPRTGRHFVWLQALEGPADAPLEFSSGSLITLDQVRDLLSAR